MEERIAELERKIALLTAEQERPALEAEGRALWTRIEDEHRVAWERSGRTDHERQKLDADMDATERELAALTAYFARRNRGDAVTANGMLLVTTDRGVVRFAAGKEQP